MNKKAGYAFRIVLGGYLAYLGIRMLIQMADERPNNMVLMSVMAVIFTVIGGGYTICSLKKVWDLRKEEMGGADVSAVEEEPTDSKVETMPEEKADRNKSEMTEEIENDCEER